MVFPPLPTVVQPSHATAFVRREDTRFSLTARRHGLFGAGIAANGIATGLPKAIEKPIARAAAVPIGSGATTWPIWGSREDANAYGP